MWWRRTRRDEEFKQEIEAHLALDADRFMADGLSPDEARAAARRAFGNATITQERFHESRGSLWLDHLRQDVRYAIRGFAQNPGFTCVAVLTLALGIAASNTIFTIANGMNLKGLPVPDADRIVVVNDPGGLLPLSVSYHDFEQWQAAARASVELAAHAGSVSTNLADDELAPEVVIGTYLSARAFGLLGVSPWLGRTLQATDDEPSAPAVVMLSHRVWKTRYGADPSLVGRAIRVNGVPSMVIGVMPEGFRFPFNHDLWRPLAAMPGLSGERRDVRLLQVFGRLTDHTTLRQAQSELSIIIERTADHPGRPASGRPTVGPFTGSIHATDPWFPLLGAAAFVLLIACVNVANLILARGRRRSREIALRVSLGASRVRLIQQLLTEHLLLAIVAGIAGLGLSLLGVRVWVLSIPDVPWPYWWDWTMDGRVFRFLATISLGTAVLFGVAPALQLSKTNVNESLKDGGRGLTGSVGARRWSTVLLALEIALTLVLLVGATLATRSFLALYRVDTVVDTSHSLLGLMSLPAQKYPSPEQRLTFITQLQDRLDSISAIASATTASVMPFIGAPRWTLTINGQSMQTGDPAPTVSYVVIGAHYFETLGVRLLRGRTFTGSDGTVGQEVAIVNQFLASRYFPHEDPIGRRIRLTNPLTRDQTAPWATIVGVSPTIRQQMGQDLDPVAYVPYRQNAGPFICVIARGFSKPEGLTSLLRNELRALDSNLALGTVMSLDTDLGGTRFPHRILLTVFLVFAVLALTLAVVGLYAVTAYAVTERTHEIGVRMALGAEGRQVVWLFVQRALMPLAAGLAIGTSGVFAVARMMQTFLVQISATDAVTVVSVALLLATVALIACIVPARRATRLDPTVALRCE